MAHKLTLSQACDGMIRYKQATGRSPHTIAEYKVTFKKLLRYFDSDPPIESITRDHLVGFFAWLQEDYISDPDGIAPREKKRLSPKSILNIHTNLSALWTWVLEEGYVKQQLVRSIDRPSVNPPVIEPLTRDEVVLLLKGCNESRSWKNRRAVANNRPTADRDRAIILTLLDTGIRASELCGIRFKDVNLTSHTIKVRGKGKGREPRERIVFIGRKTGQAIWKSLVPRLDEIKEDDPVFMVGSNEDWRPMSRNVLGKQLRRLGDKVGVDKVHPHRFRHTFAISYLRNGGDVFNLQAILGHSDLAMVQRYARIAQTDCAKTHRKASPVDRWRL